MHKQLNTKLSKLTKADLDYNKYLQRDTLQMGITKTRSSSIEDQPVNHRQKDAQLRDMDTRYPLELRRPELLLESKSAKRQYTK